MVFFFRVYDRGGDPPSFLSSLFLSLTDGISYAFSIYALPSPNLSVTEVNERTSVFSPFPTDYVSDIFFMSYSSKFLARDEGQRTLTLQSPSQTCMP